MCSQHGNPIMNACKFSAKGKSFQDTQFPHSQTGTSNLPALINPKSVSLGTAEDAQLWE